jgi:tRNA(Leu) C34 or U34 (ribose-2'-O)-methylase TrmL
LNEFVSRAFDLKAAFQHVAKFAFDNPAATQRLHDAATSYTNIYNVLNRQRMNYQKQINENWRDDSLTNEYIRVIGFALDTLHTAKLYPLQSDITLINEYFFGKKTKELKDKIQQHIKEQEISIQPTLEELRRRNLAFQKQLTL